MNSLAATVLTPQLKRFSNVHAGESCYIFGDGPSIKWMDLSAFDDRPALCCGMIPFHNDFAALDVRYASVVTPWAFVPKWYQPRLYRENRRLYAEYERTIRRLPEKQFFISLSNALALRGRNVNYVFRGLPREENETDRALNNFDLFSGSFNASLAIAYFLGFSTAYLLGFDAWVLRPARTQRWYELGDGTVMNGGDGASRLLSVLKQRMKIITIAPVGVSANTEMITYEEFTGKAPAFRENYELLSRHYLDVLASCPRYHIYGRGSPNAAVA